MFAGAGAALILDILGAAAGAIAVVAMLKGNYQAAAMAAVAVVLVAAIIRSKPRSRAGPRE
jgi:hypothetical protein